MKEVPCPGCAQKKTFGVLSYAKAKLGGKVPSHVRDMRHGICERCEETVREDASPETRTSERLSREIDGVRYCGQPHKLIERRDEMAVGCGCDLSDKVQYKKAQCPRGHWGPDNRFGAQYMPLIYEVNADESKTLKEVVDVYLPANATHADMTGIGDTLLMGPIVQAYAKKMAADGYRVRFCVPWGRTAWARFAASNVEIDDLSNADRMFGVMGYHPTDMRFFELDETARQQGTTRAGHIAQRFGLDIEAAMRDYALRLSPASVETFAADLKMNKARENGQPIIGIAPFAHNVLRTWPLRHWVKLTYILQKMFRAMIVVIDGKGSEAKTRCFPCTRWHGLNPDDTAALISRLDLVIGNDSGMAHMGGFLRVPTLALCGITDGNVVFGSYSTVEVVQARAACTGCLWFKENGFKPWCMKGCNAIEDLKPELVVERVGKVLSASALATA